MDVSIKPLGERLDQVGWRSLWHTKEDFICCFFWDVLLFHWLYYQRIELLSSVIYIYVAEANSVLHILISLGEGMMLHVVTWCWTPFTFVSSYQHGIWLITRDLLMASGDLNELPIEQLLSYKRYHHSNRLITVCRQRFELRLNCCLLISYPLTKISVHEAGADEENITRERKIILLLIGT